MPKTEDYYQVLGVRRDASQADIQKAFRDLARKYHPDVNPEKDAKKKFQQIQQAFDVLNDPKKREMYDRYGHSFQSAGGGPQGGPGPGGFGFEDVDLGQFFGERFGQGGGGPGIDLGEIFSQFSKRSRPGKRAAGKQRRGGDLENEISVPFVTAVAGGELNLGLTLPSGRSETIAVKIPAGIEEGKKIRLRGQGEPSPNGGPAGDLLLKVRVEPHPFYQRRGNDLVVRVPLTLAEAALGAKIDVPAPRGTVALHVPPGTSSGTKLRIKGQGIAPRQGPPGDLYAEVLIVIPKKLDDAGRDLVRQLDERNKLDPRAHLRW